MINHGQTINVTSTLDHIYQLLFWGGLALFVSAVVIDFYKDPFGWRETWRQGG